jgi:soluble lytic murein transglycosylase-like protein
MTATQLHFTSRLPCRAVALLLLVGSCGTAAAQPVQPVYVSQPDGNSLPHYTNEPQRPGDRLVMYSMAAQVPRIKPTLPVKPLPSVPSAALLRRGSGADVTMSVVVWRRDPRTDVTAPRPPRPLPAPPPSMPLVNEAPMPAAPANGTQVDAAIRSAARKFNVDETLIRAVIHVESGFNPGAVSPKGATGLMQLMPGTARRFGVANAKDPVQNIHGGTNYLRVLLDLFDGDLRLALAAYNAGEGAVLKYKRRIPPYEETQEYVQLVLGRYRQLRG